MAVKRTIEELTVIARAFPEAAAARPTYTGTIDEVVTAEIGAVCPRTGLWVPSTRLNMRRRIASGDPIPDIDGRQGVWVWIGPDT